MSNSISALSLRGSLCSLVVVGLAACGGVDGGGGEGEGEGNFFEDVFDDGGLLDGGEDDAGDDDNGGGPAVAYIEDAVNTESDLGAIQFTGATGRWRADINGTMIGGARLEEGGAESIAVRFDASEAGSYDCASNALISYNARDDAGAPLLYSTRPEGASCALVVESYEDVGGRIRGYFDATLIDGAGGALDMAGAFDVERLADQ